MIEKNDWVKKLDLTPHPEGGFYKEIYRSDIETNTSENNPRQRSALTSIYFLLGKDDKSHFHILQSDEIWYYHAGAAARIHFIDLNGNYSFRDISTENFQVVIPANTHFAAEVIPNGAIDYILVGCAVGPGFDFADFALSSEKELHLLCPDQNQLISELTLDN